VSGPRGECDLVVVGAGILGLAAARELLARHPRPSVQVLEREGRIAAHQTGHNSGVVHQGVYYTPGSLKAQLCVTGARELYAYCEERGIPAARCGKLIVATASEQLARLDELERRGTANGVPGLRRLRGEELAEVEPHVRGVAGLHSPATGIVDYAKVAAAYAADVEAFGGAITTGCGVTASRSRRAACGCCTARARRAPATPCSARAAGLTGSRSWPAAAPTRASCRSAAPICGCAPSGATSCAG
jgi:L-2-hydroxyglutarate oxidase LhgO